MKLKLKLNTQTLKSIAKQITPSLTIIINKILSTSEFPNILKRSIITAMFRTGNKLQMNNYRPISVISNLAKVMEKIIKSKLINYLNTYKII